MNQIKKAAFMGVFWSTADSILNQFVMLAVKLVLVRLLLPEEFGLAAMAYLVISSIDIIGSFNTGNAFVRDNDSDPVRAKNTLFYLDLIPTLLIAAIGFFSAPYAAEFFGKKISDPESLNTLLWMFRFVALIQLTSIITAVPGKMLTKELRFKEKTTTGLVGIVAYGLFTSLFAYLGWGAWAIILGQFSQHLSKKLLTFAYSPFIPSLIFDKEIAKKYLKFGTTGFYGSIMDTIIGNGDDALTGRLLGSAATGFYSLGQHFSSVVTSIVAGVISGMAFPVLSKLQKDREAFTKAFFKIYRLKNFFAVPSIVGSVVLADWIVILIFGENWLPILASFYVLSVAAFLGMITSLSGPLLDSLGKPQVSRNNRFIQFIVFLILVYPFTKLWGIAGTSMVYVVFSFVSLVYISPHIAKEIPRFYNRSSLILIKCLSASFVMAVVVHLLKINLTMSKFWMVSLVFIGAAAYFIVMWFLDKDEMRWDFEEGKSILMEKLGLIKKS